MCRPIAALRASMATRHCSTAALTWCCWQRRPISAQPTCRRRSTRASMSLRKNPWRSMRPESARCWPPASKRNRSVYPSSPACVCATTKVFAKRYGGFRTVRSARSRRCTPTTTAARSGSRRASPIGRTCTTRCATGTTTRGSPATSTWNSTSTSWTSAHGPWAIVIRSRRSAWADASSEPGRSTATSTIITGWCTSTKTAPG